MSMARQRATQTPAVDVSSWAENLPDQYLDCRDWGHTWQSHTAWWDGKARCFTRVLQCPRCGTERHQDLDAHGYVLGGHYVYPEGFLAPAGMGRLRSEERAGIRLASLQRTVTGKNVTPIRRKARK